MHDLNKLRADPESFDHALKRRGLAPQSKLILDQLNLLLTTQQHLQHYQQQRNQASKTYKNKHFSEEEKKQIRHQNETIAELKEQHHQYQKKLDNLLLELPNIPADDVPDGPDENSNLEIRRVDGSFSTGSFNFKIRDHSDLGVPQLIDYQTAASISGARFTILRRELAQLERALGQFMLDLHTCDHGYVEVSVPLLVHSEALKNTGQLPKFSDDLFQTNDSKYWLIPTSEVPLTNLVADKILDPDEDLLPDPLRYTSLTPCFRSEAGAAGKDTHGMIRQHQFWKVELVSITMPYHSEEELQRMTQCAEKVLQLLELPFRTVLLSTGDMGFAARKTYDIEVWLPSQQRYREISSCSNCGDFQARRMKARYKSRDAQHKGFVHTLNGSGVAVGRCLIAIMENYQQADGSIVIPERIRPYMNHQEQIESLSSRSKREAKGL